MESVRTVVRMITLMWIGIAGFHSSVYSQGITIGYQVWMSENLNVDRFRNGEPIPQARSNEEWKKAGENHQPAWCYYQGDPNNGAKYGKLYNWYAIKDERGLAPEGWQIPSIDDWEVLAMHLGGDSNAGASLKGGGYTTSGGYPTDTYVKTDFNALPGGSRLPDGRFINIGQFGNWWSSNGDFLGSLIFGTSDFGWYIYLNFEHSALNKLKIDANYGFSVRCIKQSTESGELQEDREAQERNDVNFDPYSQDKSWGDFPWGSQNSGTEVLGEGIYGRKVTHRADVAKMGKQSGSIRMRICVNRQGNVIEAMYLPQESTITDPVSVRRTEELASRYKFEPDSSAPAKQCGKLTFVFQTR